MKYHLKKYRVPLIFSSVLLFHGAQASVVGTVAKTAGVAFALAALNKIWHVAPFDTPLEAKVTCINRQKRLLADTEHQYEFSVMPNFGLRAKYKIGGKTFFSTAVGIWLQEDGKTESLRTKFLASIIPFLLLGYVAKS
jgi:hypothetical protein